MPDYTQESIRELRDEALEALDAEDYLTVKEKLRNMDLYFDVVPSPIAPTPDPHSRSPS
jgi:hypothetical protein